MSVAANIFLGREPRRFGMIDRRTIEREAQKYLDMVGLDVSPQTLVGTLPIGKQQLVEIAKALSTNARVLIMDEPTSSLSEHEAQKLFEVVRDLRSRGVSVMYISHRLHEIEELADRVVVLRDGKFSGELSRADNKRQNMVRLMVGREVSRFYQRTAHAPGDVVIAVSQLRTTTFPRQAVSFTVRAGEIVGLAGLVGAGRSELLGTLFGVTPAVGGGMTVRRTTSSAANRARSDCGRHHARAGRSPARRSYIADEREVESVARELATRPALSRFSQSRVPRTKWPPT